MIFKRCGVSSEQKLLVLYAPQTIETAIAGGVFVAIPVLCRCEVQTCAFDANEKNARLERGTNNQMYVLECTRCPCSQNMYVYMHNMQKKNGYMKQSMVLISHIYRLQNLPPIH